MSIIYEALQKTQQNRVNQFDPPIEIKKITRNTRWIDIGLIAIIAILLVIILFAYYPRLTKSHHVRTAKYTPVPKALSNAPHAAQTVAAKNIPAALKASTLISTAADKIDYKNLVLNGVFISDQEKVALINNKSFRLGETVEGMKIISIEPDAVKLRNENHTFSLKTAT